MITTRPASVGPFWEDSFRFKAPQCKINSHNEALILDSGYAKDAGLPEQFIICEPEGMLAVSSKYPLKYREIGLGSEILAMEDPCKHGLQARLYAVIEEIAHVKRAPIGFLAYVQFRETWFEEMTASRWVKERPELLTSMTRAHEFLKSKRKELEKVMREAEEMTH